MTTDPADIRIEEDVLFGTGAGEPLRCDVYRQRGASLAPAVLLLRSRGAPVIPGIRNALAERLARDGIVAIVPEFRVGFRVSDKGFEPYPAEVWPAGIHDVKAAVRWTRANAARLGIDTARIFLLGGSNAGIMALGAAARCADPVFEGSGGNEGQSSDVAGVIAVSTPTTLTTWGIPLIVGAGASQQTIDEASATRNVHPSFPPVMLLHGTDDPLIPPSNSTEMYDILHKAGISAELHLFAGQDHGLGSKPEFVPQISALISLFVARYPSPAR